MVWPLALTLQVVMALETSETPSPSMSSQSLSWVSAISVIDGVTAMKPKPGGTLKVSSLIMSKPPKPGSLIDPPTCSSMYEVGILFHESNDFWSAVLAAARETTGPPSGLGIGSWFLLSWNWTGMQRESWKMRTSLALICPGMGDGTLPVMSRLSRKPPASAGPAPRDAVSRAAREILVTIPLIASLLLIFTSMASPLPLEGLGVADLRPQLVELDRLSGGGAERAAAPLQLQPAQGLGRHLL